MTDDVIEDIRRRAYEMWEADGRPEGQDEVYWLAAERELAGRDIDVGLEATFPASDATTANLRKPVRE